MPHHNRSDGQFEPLGLLLISRGSKGYRLLFRYPLEAVPDYHVAQLNVNSAVPYCIRLQNKEHPPTVPSTSYVANISDFLCGLPEDIVGHLFAVGADLCGKQFELKLNDLRFVGFPQQVSDRARKPSKKTQVDHHDSLFIGFFTIVFVLKASVAKSVVTVYQDLSKLIALALNHEEARCEYLSKQESLRIGGPSDPAMINDKLRLFEEAEKRRIKQALQHQDAKAKRRMQHLMQRHEQTVRELEQIQNEKRKMLIDHEAMKLGEYDEEYLNVLKDWRSQLKPRKQLLESKFNEELGEQERFYSVARNGDASPAGQYVGQQLMQQS